MRKPVRPQTGCCLFFPDRPKGSRIVAGREVWVWWWESWKHFEIGQFSVRLEHVGRSTDDPTNHEALATTAEGLRCKVDCRFQVTVGGEDVVSQEERIERATRFCEPGRNMKAPVQLAYFRGIAFDYARNAVTRVLKERSYLRLIDDYEYRLDAYNTIERVLAESLDRQGFTLLESTVIVEPLEPGGVLATDVMREKWLEFQRQTKAAVLRLNEVDQHHAQALAEVDQRRNIHRLNLAAKLKEEERRLALEDQLRVRDHETKMLKLQQELSDANTEEQVLKNQRDAKVSEDHEARKEQLQRQKREYDVAAREHQELLLKKEQDTQVAAIKHKEHLAEQERRNEVGSLEHQAALMSRRLATASEELDLERVLEQIVTIRQGLEKNLGLQKAEVLQRERIADAAPNWMARDSVLQALPAILKEAVAQIPRIGDVRVLIGGTGGDLGRPEGAIDSLASLMRTASALPLVKEVLRLIGDLERSGDKAEDHGQTTDRDRP